MDAAVSLSPVQSPNPRRPTSSSANPTSSRPWKTSTRPWRPCPAHASGWPSARPPASARCAGPAPRKRWSTGLRERPAVGAGHSFFPGRRAVSRQCAGGRAGGARAMPHLLRHGQPGAGHRGADGAGTRGARRGGRRRSARPRDRGGHCRTAACCARSATSCSLRRRRRAAFSAPAVPVPRAARRLPSGGCDSAPRPAPAPGRRSRRTANSGASGR